MDAFAEYVQSQYKNADRNRRDLQLKWEQNRLWFVGNLYPDGQQSAGDEKMKAGEAEGWRAKTFPGTTHSKVMAAFVICLDTVLAGGQVPFMLKPSPQNRNRFARGIGEGDPAAIEAGCKAMMDLIQQQFSDCKADRHAAKNLMSLSLYGETYAKLAIKPVNRSGWEAAQPDVAGIEDWGRVQAAPQWVPWSETILAPHWIYRTVWDIFRDWETDDMAECSFIIDRQVLDNYWIASKRNKPFFLDAGITAALEAKRSDGTKSNPSVQNNEDTGNMAPNLRNYVTSRTRDRQLLEFWGRVPRNVVEGFERSQADEGRPALNTLVEGSGNGDEVECHGMVIDGAHTIRFVKTEPKMRPFAYARWEDNCDEWASRGVADNCLEMSKVIRGAFRSIEDGAKITGNPMTAVKRRFIKQMPKELKPGLFIDLAEDCDDARKALQPVVIPDVSGAMRNLFDIAQQQNEMDSMVPRIAQGQLEDSDQTAREASIRQAQSLKYIGMAIRNFDNGVIEEMVEKFYDYNMNDPDVQEGKGNYLAQALGFTSFQNRTERLTALNMMLERAVSLEPVAAIANIEWIWTEIVKAVDMDPAQAIKTPEQKQQFAEEQAKAAAQAAEAQAVAVERERAAAAKDKAQAVKSLADAQAVISSPVEPVGPAVPSLSMPEGMA
jgi:hypothetical protein